MNYEAPRMRATVYAIATTLLATIVTPQSLAQTTASAKDTGPLTKLEAFNSNKGKLLIRDRYRLGEVPVSLGSVEISALVIYEPGKESDRIKGLRIEVTEAGRLERSNTSFLDLDEIAAVSQSLSYMSDLASKSDQKEYTEVSFKTKGDFDIGFFKSSGRPSNGAYVASGSIGKVTAFLPSLQSLSAVKNILDSGLALLNTK
jgi:hypothetical protein